MSVLPCTVETASRVTLLWTQMLTKCKPDKAKSKTDPTYVIRGQFLDFLQHVYKCAVNNRRPSRTGELSLINNYIAEKVREFIFGTGDQLVFTDGSRVMHTKFPVVKGILLLCFFPILLTCYFDQKSMPPLRKSRTAVVHMSRRPSTTSATPLPPRQIVSGRILASLLLKGDRLSAVLVAWSPW